MFFFEIFQLKFIISDFTKLFIPCLMNRSPNFFWPAMISWNFLHEIIWLVCHIVNIHYHHHCWKKSCETTNVILSKNICKTLLAWICLQKNYKMSRHVLNKNLQKIPKRHFWITPRSASYFNLNKMSFSV
jgi:hypothetical protein